MQEASEHPDKHGFRSIVPGEDILLQHLLPAALVNLVSEEMEKRVVVVPGSKVLLKPSRITQLFKDVLIDGRLCALISLVRLIVLLNLLGRSVQCPDAKKMMSNMVVQTSRSKEDVITIVVSREQF